MLIATALHTIDLIVVFVYMTAILLVGWYFSRGQKETQQFFVGNRSMPWLAVGLSIVATMLSTLTYLAAPGEMIQHGPAFALGWLVIPLVFFVVNRIWIPFFMKLRVTSIYEYLEPRFGLATRWVAVGLFVFVLRLLWMAMIVLTASLAVAQITHDIALESLPWHPSMEAWTVQVLWSVGILATLYTMLGGIKAVIWTDVAQFVALFAGIVLTITFIALETQTGPLQWWKTLSAESNGWGGFPDWVSFDITNRNVILFPLLHAVTWYTCTFIADQVAVQRYLTTSSIQAAQRGNIVNFVSDFLIMLLLAICGMALLTYYLDPAQQTVIAEGISDPRHQDVADKVFPHFIAHGLPVGVSGLVIAALFAVAMSSLDSGLNSIATIITVDIAKRCNPDLSESRALRLARILTLVVGVVTTLGAYVMYLTPNHYNIVGYTARTFNLALGSLGMLFIVGLFIPRVGQRAVLVGVVVSFLVATYTAWYVELLWVLGQTDYEELVDAQEFLRGPSPYLIAPFALISGIATSLIASYIFPNYALETSRQQTWSAITRRPAENPSR